MQKFKIFVRVCYNKNLIHPKNLTCLNNNLKVNCSSFMAKKNVKCTDKNVYKWPNGHIVKLFVAEH